MDSFNLLDLISFVDIIDIVLVALLMYYIYRLVKGTVAINIFIGIVIVYLIWVLTEALDMVLLSNILGKFISVGLIALIVVFQQEIRKFLLMLGSTNFATKRSFIKHFKFLRPEPSSTDTEVEVIIAALKKMGASKTGVLLVLERTNSLDFVKSSGDKMNIEVTKPILESIFYKNSPLHDGAAIIEGNYITATRVILPVSNERNIPLRFGLRHRAAIGITEKTDALALVVSEETGDISYMKDGAFIPYKDEIELTNFIKKDLA